MKSQQFTITINAPVSKVRDTMLSHPTYEEWTTIFSPGSTYTGTREQGTEIRFTGPEGDAGMLGTIAVNKHHAYISLKYIGEVGLDQVAKNYDYDSYENYSFTKIDDFTTRLDVEMTALPEEYLSMFEEMWPKALVLLKEICEQ